jgi:hypothetical protein
MTRRCLTWQSCGRRAHSACTFCGAVAVFHWKTTYPDLLLCRDCLDAYPEATVARSTHWILSDDSIRRCQNTRSWQRLLQQIPGIKTSLEQL